MRLRLLVLTLSLSLAACSKDSAKESSKSSTAGKDGKDGKDGKAADDEGDQGKPKKKKAKEAADDDAADDKPAKKKEESPNHEIDGVGAIPPWAAEAPAKKCAAPAGAKAALGKLDKADDAELDEGKKDVAALVKDVAGDCADAKRSLAASINTGGMKHYDKKAWQKANRWWRAGLTVRPAFILARYNLACGLALDGKPKDALREIQELARAAKADDPDAANVLEKARSDKDLESIRDDADFKKALESVGSGGGLIGPRKEPETAAAGVKLLPNDFRTGVHPATEEKITYKPAIENVWSWKPAEGVDLVVATVVSDPATAHAPKGDLNADYGALVVYQRDGEKLKLLLAHKTGESAPSAISAKGSTLTYKFTFPCGDLKGNFVYAAGKVSVKEDTCGGAAEPPKKKVTCGPNDVTVDGECHRVCGEDKDCPAGMHCQDFRTANPNGGTSSLGMGCDD